MPWFLIKARRRHFIAHDHGIFFDAELPVARVSCLWAPCSEVRNLRTESGFFSFIAKIIFSDFP